MSGVLAVVAVGAIIGAARHDDFDSDAQPAQTLSSPGHAPSFAGAWASRLGATSGHCGALTAEAIASVDAKVAQRIYTGELRGSEVSTDMAHVERDAELRSALANSNRAAAYTAVHALVYTPHWHIVRLRVVKNGRVLADVGGPDIIAPVSGSMEWQGKKIGSYTLSVQDDVGFVKLVSRFIGVPIDLYMGGSFLMGTLEPAPISVREGQSVTVAGSSYRAQLLNALSFPAGTLQAALFVPKPTAAMAERSCAAVQVAAWGAIVRHIAARYASLSSHYDDLVGTIKGSTVGLAYVRSGSKRLAGGTGPAHLPHSDSVKYLGHRWWVYSWEPVPPARVYLLVRVG